MLSMYGHQQARALSPMLFPSYELIQRLFKRQFKDTLSFNFLYFWGFLFHIERTLTTRLAPLSRSLCRCNSCLGFLYVIIDLSRGPFLAASDPNPGNQIQVTFFTQTTQLLTIPSPHAILYNLLFVPDRNVLPPHYRKR